MTTNGDDDEENLREKSFLIKIDLKFKKYIYFFLWR